MDQYKIIKVIGDGTYGVVSKAINIKTNETVAIKKMKQKFPSWDECIQLREVKSLRKLNHPNIIRLKEVIRVNDILHLVFEFAENNLYQLMKSRGNAFSEIQIQSIIHQTLLGISYTHKNGFFHRDLKPENLMTNNSLTNPIIKICDFGQAREIRSTPPYTEYIATRWYRAPECLLRSNVYSSPVDIFALGCIMAELYLGRPLFPGTSESDQLFKICSVLGTPTSSTWSDGLKLGAKIGYQFPNFVATPISSIIQNANPEAIDLMNAMLNFDPQKRITAVHALAHPFFASFPKDITSPSIPISKRIPEFSGIITDGIFERFKVPDQKKDNETNDLYAKKKITDDPYPQEELQEKDGDSNKSFTKYSLNDSIDSANHSKGFHKDNTSSKSSKSHNQLPQADIDDISDILNDKLFDPFEDKKEPKEIGYQPTENSKSRRKYLKQLKFHPQEEKKLGSNSKSFWGDNATDSKLLEDIVGMRNEQSKPRRELNRKPIIIPTPSVVPPIQSMIASNNPTDFSPSGFSGETNFTYHKRYLGAATNSNAEIAGSGIRAAIRDTYKKDMSLIDVYGIDSSRPGRKIEDNLYAPYEQPTSGTLSYGALGMNGQSMGNNSKAQFNYGRYKYQ